MKIKIGFSFLFILMILFISCQQEEVKNSTVLDDEVVALITNEVLADINFAELLDEGDDGIFWGDNMFSMLKSVENGTCPAKTRDVQGSKVTVTLEFLEGDCEKSGTIIIEYHKPNDKETKRKKTVTYIDFVNKNGVTFNGVKNIERGNGNYNIKAEMVISKTNDENEAVIITRNYHRQIHWICGLDSKDREDNIKKVTGQTEVTVKVGEGDERSYSRKIRQPLLIVKACDLKIQAGTVKVEKANGTEIKIDYGKMPKDINCEDDFICETTFEVTKDGKTWLMELVDGKRVKLKDE